jgi:tetratricopeptide (TPR) repeat protein
MIGRTMNLLALAALMAVAAPVGVTTASDRTLLPGNVELRVELTDETGNSVSGDRFVQGEVILIRATLTALEMVQAEADHEGAQRALSAARVAGKGAAAAKAEKALSEAEARLDTARRNLAASPLRAKAQALTAAAAVEGGDKSRPAVQLTAAPLERSGGEDLDGRTNGARTERWWSVDSGPAPAGNVALQVAAASSEGAPGAAPAKSEIRFQVVAANEAKPDELGRVNYVKAHVALDAKRYEDAARLAEQALQYSNGSPDYQRLATLHVLGDANFQLGNKQAALAAYRQLLEIVQTSFPKSHLPEIIGPRVQKLEAALGNQ